MTKIQKIATVVTEKDYGWIARKSGVPMSEVKAYMIGEIVDSECRQAVMFLYTGRKANWQISKNSR